MCTPPTKERKQHTNTEGPQDGVLRALAGNATVNIKKQAHSKRGYCILSVSHGNRHIRTRGKLTGLEKSLPRNMEGKLMLWTPFDPNAGLVLINH